MCLSRYKNLAWRKKEGFSAGRLLRDIERKMSNEAKEEYSEQLTNSQQNIGAEKG